MGRRAHARPYSPKVAEFECGRFGGVCYRIARHVDQNVCVPAKLNLTWSAEKTLLQEIFGFAGANFIRSITIPPNKQGMP